MIAIIQEALQKIAELSNLLHKLSISARRAGEINKYENALSSLTRIERLLKNDLQYLEKDQLQDWKEGNPIHDV